MNVIETVGISKAFGKVQALSNVNLEVKQGEVFGFIGPNGAGKSTTIRILLGILKASQGEAKIFGLNAWQDAVAIHKRLAYVPGDVNLWPNLTGGEVIDLFMSLQGASNPNKKAELIERFDLDPTKKCRSYSKGNRQKVALVAAFASDAELYILDEPTSGLDPLMERVFQECVMEVTAKGGSVLLSSHILSEVEKLCDRIAIIREGSIIETGTLSEMRHLTRNLLTVVTEKPVMELKNQPGVYDVVGDSHKFSFQVDSDKLGNLLNYLAPYHILQLESTSPTLEDLFLRHYLQQEDGGQQDD